MKYLLILMLAGCTAAKHETTSLQCIGFCAFTNVNHETNKEQEK